MTGLTIRAACPADRPSLTHAALASWLDAYAHLLPPEQVADAPAMLERAFDKRLPELRVALSEDLVLGFYSLGDAADPERRDYLWHLYVDPAAQRRGVGRALLAAALDELRGRGAPRAWLDVIAGNAKALAFYRACGFSDIGRFREDGLDYLILERALPPQC